ncbi:hypothetical protein HHK36_032678 [Tetracentron sinense]|uniref:Retrotransposon Copia-like N-terminal domain-containing protein n=1 Tax=Tetracentron sinense TaxID=13715 RepID=A0A835CWV8_TETSI|nr:hypothetical protein HHK36_032678 [Tetracentron sinense]
MAEKQTKPEADKYDNPNDHFYLHHSDQPGVVLVTQLLNEENYGTWSRAMLMALNIKNKEGFINGTIQKPATTSTTELQQWTRCNNLVKSWLLNSISHDIGASVINNEVAHEIWDDLKERFSRINSVHLFHVEEAIHDCKQDNMTIGAYYTKLKGLWDEQDTFCSIPTCTCGTVKEVLQFQQSQKTMKFLMGLNEAYTAVRGQILLMDPLPTVNKAHSLIIQDERQRAVSKGSEPVSDITAFADQRSGKMIGTGTERGGLYYLNTSKNTRCSSVTATVSHSSRLWHQRLGHLSNKILRLISHSVKDMLFVILTISLSYNQAYEPDSMRTVSSSESFLILSLLVLTRFQTSTVMPMAFVQNNFTLANNEDLMETVLDFSQSFSATKNEGKVGMKIVISSISIGVGDGDLVMMVSMPLGHFTNFALLFNDMKVLQIVMGILIVVWMTDRTILSDLAILSGVERQFDFDHSYSMLVAFEFIAFMLIAFNVLAGPQNQSSQFETMTRRSSTLRGLTNP